MESHITREAAVELLRKYNKDPFHLRHALTVEALMRPSKSVQDMELKSLKKKYKVKTFAAGCSREVIEQGAEMLGWTLDEVLQKTLDAMRDSEETIAEETARHTGSGYGNRK